jgi:hypothetical protein
MRNFFYCMMIFFYSCKSQKCELSGTYKQKIQEYEMSSPSSYMLSDDVRMKSVIHKYCSVVNDSEGFLIFLASSAWNMSECSALIYFPGKEQTIYCHAKDIGADVFSGPGKYNRELRKVLDTIRVDIKPSAEKLADYSDSRQISEGLIINCIYVTKKEGVLVCRTFTYPW